MSHGHVNNLDQKAVDVEDVRFSQPCLYYALYSGECYQNC
jgi:hypothetical protein